MNPRPPADGDEDARDGLPDDETSNDIVPDELVDDDEEAAVETIDEDEEGAGGFVILDSDAEVGEDDRDAAALVPVRGERLPVPVDPLARYIQEVRLVPDLEPEAEWELATRYHEHEDQDAARRLITANLKLVVKLALMYRRAFRNVWDLIQEGNVGLMEALRRFDPAQGVKFSTYAAWWAKAYMLKFLLDNARLVRVGTTNARRKLIYNLRKEQRKLEAEGITPTTRLLAERFGVSEDDVIDVDRALASGDVSVDAPIGEDSARTYAEILPAQGASAEDQVALGDLREKVERALDRFRVDLSERDRALLDERLAADEPKTLQELGEAYGVTREAMRQAENKLKKRLAEFLRAELGEEVEL